MFVNFKVLPVILYVLMLSYKLWKYRITYHGTESL